MPSREQNSQMNTSDMRKVGRLYPTMVSTCMILSPVLPRLTAQ